jgi:nicotinate-nucleotide adenylyltransferase
VAANNPVWYLVPDGVVQYIAKYGLYLDDPAAANAPTSEASEPASTE